MPDAPDGLPRVTVQEAQTSYLSNLMADKTNEWEKEFPEQGVIIHFLEDGFTFFGEIWYRGQELKFADLKEVDLTRDMTGKSWLALTEQQQVIRYGRVMFRRGAWPYAPYEDAEAAKAERDRGRKVPQKNLVSDFITD